MHTTQGSTTFASIPNTVHSHVPWRFRDGVQTHTLGRGPLQSLCTPRGGVGGRGIDAHTHTLLGGGPCTLHTLRTDTPPVLAGTQASTFQKPTPRDVGYTYRPHRPTMSIPPISHGPEGPSVPRESCKGTMPGRGGRKRNVPGCLAVPSVQHMRASNPSYGHVERYKTHGQRERHYNRTRNGAQARDDHQPSKRPS